MSLNNVITSSIINRRLDVLSRHNETFEEIK